MIKIFLFSIYNILHKFGGNIRWETETKTIPEHGEHFNESIVNEVILEDMEKKTESII